ncbi:MAG: hypothetical protein V4539_20420 [Bacteroidota bacterium]
MQSTNEIATLWIESEVKIPLDGQRQQYDDNSDVIITFNDGTRYVATFFTLQNIQTLRENYKISGECLAGKYFWASDLILIDSIERSEILTVVKHLIASGEFQSIFRKLL